MAYDQHLEDYPTCANINHAILNIQVVFCPHDSSYTMSCMLGNETERPWSHQVWRYGPFDDITVIAADVAKYLSVVGRRRLLTARLHIDDSD